MEELLTAGVAEGVITTSARAAPCFLDLCQQRQCYRLLR